MITKEQLEYGADECAKQGHYPNSCKCSGEALQSRAEKAEAALDAARENEEREGRENQTLRARVAELEKGYRDIEAKDRSSVDQVMFAKTVGEVYRRVMPEFSMRADRPVRTCKTCGGKTVSTSTIDMCIKCGDDDGLRPQHFLTQQRQTRSVSTDQVEKGDE